MKYLIIIGDGMADRPIASLNNKTPLMIANIPHIHSLCKGARCGKLITVPPDMAPGSEVANLSILGYDLKKVYQGRGVLEAASIGVQLFPTDLALRCNLICIENGVIKNHSAGHISTDEARILIDEINNRLGSDLIRFHAGVSYRHIAVVANGCKEIFCTPPHDVPGTPFKDVLIKEASPQARETATLLNDLILKSQDILCNHPVNKKRIAAGKDPANSLWFWSPGNKPDMKTILELYGKTGAVISAVDLLHGIGIYCGMEVIKVPGATGLYNTNYEGKTSAAIEALDRHDMVYLHLEATDEAGHEGDIQLKIKALEALDKRVVASVMESNIFRSGGLAVALLPDHATPCEKRTHVHDPVPFLIYKPGQKPDSVNEYNESSTDMGAYGVLEGNQFIKNLFAPAT